MPQCSKILTENMNKKMPVMVCLSLHMSWKVLIGTVQFRDDSGCSQPEHTTEKEYGLSGVNEHKKNPHNKQKGILEVNTNKREVPAHRIENVKRERKMFRNGLDKSVANMNSAVSLKTQISLEKSASFLSPTSGSLCITSVCRSAISLLYWPSAVLLEKQR